MTGDYTRFTFAARRRYSTVYMQQGRLYLDQDKNADSDIQRYANRTLAEDVLGRFGLSAARWPNAFLIGHIAGPPEDLSIGEGRLYINGIQIEHFTGEGATYLKQPFLPLPPPLPAGDANVHLRVWDREITYIENPELLDVALGGNDTTTRLQTVWQLIIEGLDRAVCGAAPPLVSAGRLTTGAVAPPAPDDPCIVPPLVGYRGIENRTYKVMIFEGGPLGVARFMFSRDAGSVASAVFDMAVGGAETTLTVNRIGRDPVLRFRAGDWVTVTDDHRELMLLPPEPAQVVDIDEANRRIVLDRALPAADPTPFGTNTAEIAARHTKIIRWDQTGALAPIDADGLITTGPGPIPLEDGIQVEFSMDPVGGEFLTGDCWLFAARTADASVEELVAATPRRTFHVAQVAAAHGLGGPNPVIDDCRPPPTTPQEGCACTVCVTPQEHINNAPSIQMAIDQVIKLGGGTVCLTAGQYPLRVPLQIEKARSLRLVGKGDESRLVSELTAIEVTDSHDVTLESFSVQCGGGSTTPGSIILLNSSSQLRLAHLRLFVETNPLGPGWSGIGLSGALDGVTIRGCDVTTPAGIVNAPVVKPTATGVVDLCIEDNRFACAEVAVRLSDVTMLQQVSRIAGNRVTGCRVAGFELTCATVKGFGIEVIANELRVGGNGIVSGVSGLRAIDNDLIGPKFTAIDTRGILLTRSFATDRMDDVQIAGNRITEFGIGIFAEVPLGAVAIARNQIAHTDIGVVVTFPVESLSIMANQMVEIIESAMLIKSNGGGCVAVSGNQLQILAGKIGVTIDCVDGDCVYSDNHLQHIQGGQADGVALIGRTLIVTSNRVVGARMSLTPQLSVFGGPLCTVVGNITGGEILINNAAIPLPWSPLNLQNV